MSADTLTALSRDFYERAKSKIALSITVSAVALAFLGFCAFAGGEAAAANNLTGESALSNNLKNALGSIQAGSGFAAFLFIISFFLMLSAAFYISPLVTGSANEKKVLRAPQEVDTGFSYTDSGDKR
jgi:TRAP-type C4-dicarboxylate transport system permease small subunit